MSDVGQPYYIPSYCSLGHKHPSCHDSTTSQLTHCITKPLPPERIGQEHQYISTACHPTRCWGYIYCLLPYYFMMKQEAKYHNDLLIWPCILLPRLEMGNSLLFIPHANVEWLHQPEWRIWQLPFPLWGGYFLNEATPHWPLQHQPSGGGSGLIRGQNTI